MVDRRRNRMTLAVITGAAGALGRSVLADLTARGHDVVAMDRPGPGLDEVGGWDRVTAVAVDLTAREDTIRAWQDVDRIGVPTALVALAGRFTPGKLAELDKATLDGLWGGNVATVLWSAQQAA